MTTTTATTATNSFTFTLTPEQQVAMNARNKEQEEKAKSEFKFYTDHLTLPYAERFEVYAKREGDHEVKFRELAAMIEDTEGSPFPWVFEFLLPDHVSPVMFQLQEFFGQYYESELGPTSHDHDNATWKLTLLPKKEQISE